MKVEIPNSQQSTQIRAFHPIFHHDNIGPAGQHPNISRQNGIHVLILLPTPPFRLPTLVAFGDIGPPLLQVLTKILWNHPMDR